jgi:2-amino-4-hydroxy-6-hydroxymethyldihydropteridine diphosphokinase
VALGGNLGDAHATLASTILALNDLPWTHLEAVSPAYVSAPVDALGPDFVNAVVALQTRLAPLELLHALQVLEVQHGRKRPYLNAPRTLDLDLIWMAGAQRNCPELQLPHPRWQQRAFVVEPLADVLSSLPPGDVPALPSSLQRAQLRLGQALHRSSRSWLR